MTNDIITVDGIDYQLIDDAYATNVGSPARVVYEAQAVICGAPEDEYGCLDVCTLVWEVSDPDAEDEADACDWSNPDRVLWDGLGLTSDGRLI